MKRNFKLIFVLVLLLLFSLQNFYLSSQWFGIDFIFLIMLYTALKSSLFKTGLVATIGGLIIDYLSGGILGVFGFSRTLIIFIIRGALVIVDLKKDYLVFLMVSVSLSLSNIIANLLMYLILSYPFSWYLFIFQPIFTGFISYLIIKNKNLRRQLDVY